MRRNRLRRMREAGTKERSGSGALSKKDKKALCIERFGARAKYWNDKVMDKNLAL